jgi:hypothetical protein
VKSRKLTKFEEHELIAKVTLVATGATVMFLVQELMTWLLELRIFNLKV